MFCTTAEIECGVPAHCSTARLVAQTGRSLLDVAVYQCVRPASVDGTPAVTAIVCQLDGTWSPPTAECVEQIEFLTPQHPLVPPSRRWRHRCEVRTSRALINQLINQSIFCIRQSPWKNIAIKPGPGKNNERKKTREREKVQLTTENLWTVYTRTA